MAALPPAGPWVVRSVFCGLLVAAFTQELERARTAKLLRRDVFWYAALAVMAFLTRVVIMLSRGPLDPDFLAAALVVYWVLVALRLGRAREESATDYALFVVIGVFTALVKLSYLPVFAATLAGAWLWRKSGGEGLARLAGMMVSVLAVWLVRGVLLTGCLLYPAQQTCIYSLPWSVTPEQVSWYVLAVKSWARDTGNFDYHAVVSNWNRLRPWLGRMLQHRLVLIGLMGVAAGAVAGLRRRSSDLRGFCAGRFLVASLGWWFLSAPDPRFTGGTFIALGLLGFGLLLAAMLPRAWSRPEVLRHAPLAMAGFIVLASVRSVLVAAPPLSDEPPVTKALEFRDPSLPRIWVPELGERCWDHPLPCAPYIHPDTWRRVRWPQSLPVFAESSFVTPPGWPECKSEDSRRHPAAFWPREQGR